MTDMLGRKGKTQQFENHGLRRLLGSFYFLHKLLCVFHTPRSRRWKLPVGVGAGGPNTIKNQ